MIRAFLVLALAGNVLLAQTESEATLLRLAERSRTEGPWTVTTGRPPLKIPVNDYYSEAPYWWPDPKDPAAPYIRRDGETNPNRFEANRRALGRMAAAVLTLGLAAERWPDRGFGERGGEVVRVWFLRPATKMNPHLEYGQAVRGRNTGRGAGIIDSRDLIYAVEGIRRLEARGVFTETEKAGLRDWFRQYTRWLLTSKLGLAEKNSGNNHANWWTAQVAAYAHFTADLAVRQEAYRHFRETLVPKQILADGSAPREEARTRSLSYSAFSLDALAVVCHYASRDGENLWSTANLPKALTYLTPFLLQPSDWKKPQITAFHPEDHFFPLLAGDLVSYRRLPTAADVRRLLWEAETPALRAPARR